MAQSRKKPAGKPAATTAIPVAAFLDSIGVVTTFPDRGQPLPKTIAMIKYGGFRWIRGGIEGLTTQGPTTVQTYLDLHKQTGVRISWGLVSGGTVASLQTREFNFHEAFLKLTGTQFE